MPLIPILIFLANVSASAGEPGPKGLIRCFDALRGRHKAVRALAFLPDPGGVLVALGEDGRAGYVAVVPGGAFRVRHGSEGDGVHFRLAIPGLPTAYVERKKAEIGHRVEYEMFALGSPAAGVAYGELLPRPADFGDVAPELRSDLAERLRGVPAEYLARATDYADEVEEMKRNPGAYRERRVREMLLDVLGYHHLAWDSVGIDMKRFLADPRGYVEGSEKLRPHGEHVLRYLTDELWRPIEPDRAWFLQALDACLAGVSDPALEGVAREERARLAAAARG